jgi:hypothetical protein
VSLNNEKSCREIGGDKIAVCEKTAGLWSGNFSDLNSACSKMLVPVQLFQFQDMGNESERYRDAANGLNYADMSDLVILSQCFRHSETLIHQVALHVPCSSSQ